MSARSKGAVAFARLGIVQAELARRLDVSTGIVAMWISGERKPGLPNRKLLLERYAIPIESWDEMPSIHFPQPSETETNWGARSVSANVDVLESMVTTLMRKLKEDGCATPTEQARCMNILSHTLRNIRRLKGEDAAEINVLRHPKWIELQELIVSSLEPFPDALDALLGALESADGDGRKTG